MKKNKTIYWIFTGLLSAFVLMGAGMYFFNNPMVTDMFGQLGFPAWLVYPLGTAKVLAVVAILSDKHRLLRELAYAGLFYTFILGILAHVMSGVGSFVGALVALILLVGSYYYKDHAQRNSL